MKKKPVKKVASPKPFDFNTLVEETNIPVTPRSEGTTEMFEKLDSMRVGGSYKLPKQLEKVFLSARGSLQRVTKKVFIFRRIDKFNFRCWRLADGTQLTTRRKTPLKKAA